MKVDPLSDNFGLVLGKERRNGESRRDDTWAKGYVAKLSLGLGSIAGPASVLRGGAHPSPSAVTSAASERAKAPR